MSPTTRTVAKLSLALWFAVLVFMTPAALITDQVRNRHEAITLVSATVISLLLTALLYRAFQTVRDWSHLAWGLTLGLGAAAAGALQVVLDLAVRAVLHGAFEDRVALDLEPGVLALYVLVYICIFGGNAAIFVIAEATRRARLEEDLARRQELGLARLEAETAWSELERLRLQTNPAFMHSSLAAISRLVREDREEDAREMADRLARYLRESIQDNSAEVSVSEEFGILDAYLEVEAVRLGDRLVVDLDYPDALAAVTLPQFILQPLVETAIVAVGESGRDPLTIRATASGEAGDLLLSVVAEAEGERSPSDADTAGLDNVRRRLAIRYGDAASLRADRTDRTFEAVIRIPATPVG